VERPFQIYVNGVPQVEGEDYDLVGSTIIFERQFARESKLGWWRSALLFRGIAGTYRQQISIHVAFKVNGRNAVSSLKPLTHRTLTSD